MLCEYGEAGPFDPMDEREESRWWWEKRPIDLGVTCWPFGGIHASVCIASVFAKKGADDSWAAWLLCPGAWNKEDSASVGVGMLSKADKGDEPRLEYCSDCVEMGDDDTLL